MTTIEDLQQFVGRGQRAQAAVDEILGVQRCHVCGCTDDAACDGGCWWVDADLCSSCSSTSAAAAAYVDARRPILTTTVPPHPAEYSADLIPLFREAIWPDLVPARRRDLLVLDPFAGTGGVHALRYTPTINGRGIRTIGVELMPRWAAASPFTVVGDATDLQSERGRFDAVVTSPCYGNRFADHHDAGDTCSHTTYRKVGTKRMAIVHPIESCPKCKGGGLSHRRSYAHYYGRDAFLADAPIEANAGAMAWGDEYRDLHRRAWSEVERVLRVGGRFVLNVKDHVKNNQRVRVARWHRNTVLELRFEELWRWDVPLDGYGFGANRGARIPTEQVYVFERVR